MPYGIAVTSGFAEQRKRWGDAVDPGLLIVPSVLLRFQHKLGLDSTDLVVLFNLIDLWGDGDLLHRPRFNLIASRKGVHKRTIERSVARLIALGYIKRRQAISGSGERVCTFDFSGLIVKLQELSRKTPAQVLRRTARG